MRLRFFALFIVGAAALSFAHGYAAGIGPVEITNSYTYPYTENQWATCVSFRNVTSQTIVAVQFQFTYVDAFDDTIQSNRGDRVGEFSPGVLIEGASEPSQLPGPGIGGGNISQHAANCWYVPIVAGSLSKIIAEVRKVRYADGTIWTNSGSEGGKFTAEYMPPYAKVPGPHPAKIKCHPDGAMSFITLTLDWDDPRTNRSSDCRAQKEKYDSAPAPKPSASAYPAQT